MKWYKFPLEEYRQFKLADAEDLAFRRMMDLYYTLEGPLPVEGLDQKIGLDWDCIEPVLNQFFERTPNGWVNEFLQEDIVRRKSRTNVNRISGKHGGRPRRVK